MGGWISDNTILVQRLNMNPRPRICTGIYQSLTTANVY